MGVDPRRSCSDGVVVGFAVDVSFWRPWPRSRIRARVLSFGGTSRTVSPAATSRCASWVPTAPATPRRPGSTHPRRGRDTPTDRSRGLTAPTETSQPKSGQSLLTSRSARQISPTNRGPATERSGTYPDGTHPRWPDPTCRTQHWLSGARSVARSIRPAVRRPPGAPSYHQPQPRLPRLASRVA